ncbi:hypothetical protein J6590_009744 [Homalodisca vitripennis]|nr:hypothetical protein J6590_009744 [Homalodisca vitripennis]
MTGVLVSVAVTNLNVRPLVYRHCGLLLLVVLIRHCDLPQVPPPLPTTESRQFDTCRPQESGRNLPCAHWISVGIIHAARTRVVASDRITGHTPSIIGNDVIRSDQHFLFVDHSISTGSRLVIRYGYGEKQSLEEPVLTLDVSPGPSSYRGSQRAACECIGREVIALFKRSTKRTGHKPDNKVVYFEPSLNGRKQVGGICMSKPADIRTKEDPRAARRQAIPPIPSPPTSSSTYCLQIR